MFHFFWPPFCPLQVRFHRASHPPTILINSHTHTHRPARRRVGAPSRAAVPNLAVAPRFFLACSRIPPHLPPWRRPLGPRGLPVFVAMHRTRLMRSKEGAQRTRRGGRGFLQSTAPRRHVSPRTPPHRFARRLPLFPPPRCTIDNVDVRLAASKLQNADPNPTNRHHLPPAPRQSIKNDAFHRLPAGRPGPRRRRRRRARADE